MSKAILITGATGKQGGAVIRSLLKANANVEILALTRDAKSPSAQKLSGLSPKIKLVVGDLDQPENIFQKVKEITKLPVWGAFSVQAAIGNKSEEKQGKDLITAAINNNVKHFIYSSVDRGGAASDNSPTNVPHFIAKHNIERFLFEKGTEHGMDWTVLRPVAFFENLVPGFVGKVFATSWDLALRKEKKLQLIATTDIGFFATEAFLKPDEYKGQKISLAGDELTYDEFKSIFEQKTGEKLPTTFKLIGSALNYMVKDFGYMFKWFNDVGYGADIASLRKINPEIKDFATWLETESLFKKN
ncbi:hypothetical protein TWF788_001347 [Orbilia oligospora]|uniref:NmrA-like domain-containing protein n=1 Tax=Orbilia oligospora TaxID=2813651 RepID=A0A7C8PDN6_ORBOL|nr:hypothetical protein TWF788_001347 [Orbilia oligospora]